MLFIFLLYAFAETNHPLLFKTSLHLYALSENIL